MSDVKKMVDSFGRTQEERANRMEIIEKANKEAAENWEDPQWRRDFAADLTESILLGFEFETLVDRWIDTERDRLQRTNLHQRGGWPEGLLHGPWWLHRGVRAHG